MAMTIDQQTLTKEALQAYRSRWEAVAQVEAEEQRQSASAQQLQRLNPLLNPNSKLLFQGDSITDTGRNREIAQTNIGSALGTGYCHLIAAQLLANRPNDGLQIYNRGISGNRVVDLYARWRMDAINLQPDVISILIGVNDT